METMEGPVPEVRIEGEPAVAEELGQNVDEIIVKVGELEQRLNEVEQFYSKTGKKQSNTSKASSVMKEKDKDKQITSFKRRQLDASRREAAAAKRMQDLMRQFSVLLHTGHKWAGPFMQPVDVVGLGLHDYYEEERRRKEEAEAQLDMQLAQEVSHAKMARDLSAELDVVDKHLKDLREVVLKNCRKMSTEEKKALMTVLTQLSPEDLNKALLIVAQNNPNFQATGQEVDLDIDAQSESTLWKLKFFVKDLLQGQGKSPTSIGGSTMNNNGNQNKRKREIIDAPVKPPTQKKNNKKPS
ncbi:hypothetical protein L2E82_52426 [Cichorium intybus]|nr:hypothetical protein L2E82_52426 [Cichorium intybus]